MTNDDAIFITAPIKHPRYLTYQGLPSKLKQRRVQFRLQPEVLDLLDAEARHTLSGTEAIRLRFQPKTVPLFARGQVLCAQTGKPVPRSKSAPTFASSSSAATSMRASTGGGMRRCIADAVRGACTRSSSGSGRTAHLPACSGRAEMPL